MSFIRTALIGSVALASVSLGACTIESTPAATDCPTPSGSSSGGTSSSSSSSGSAPLSALCIRTSDITASETWSPASCPSGYLVKRDIALKGGASVELKLEPGTLVKFDADAGLRIEESAALIAEGTAEQKIHFTGYQEASGTWLGLLIASNNVKNKIAFAKIDSAGAGNELGRGGALHVGNDYQEGARVDLSDTEIAGNKRFGIAIKQSALLAKMDRVVIKDNVAGGAYVQPGSVAQLKGTGNVFEANGADNVVMIEASILVPLTVDAVWPNVAPAKYRVVGQHLIGGSSIFVKRHLTIEAGTVMELAGGSGILLEGGTAGLNAVGTAAKPIVFQGVNDSSWKGITFGETTWSDNRLENVKIKNASDAPEFQYYGTGADHGTTAVLLGYNGAIPVHLSMKDVTFSGPNNAEFDITKKPACNLVLEGNNVGHSGSSLNVQDL